MAITQRDTGGIKVFYGLAADTKPTTDVPVGSTFRVTDTGAEYVFDGITWDLDVTSVEDGASEATVADILAALQRPALVGSDIGTAAEVGYGTGQISAPVIPEQLISQTGIPSFVPDSAASGIVLAANSARTRAVLTNTSSAVCYLLGAAAAASATAFTARLEQYDPWIEEGEGIYVGEFRAVWASDPNDGGLVIVEYTG